jgi:hypothetical protein
MWTECLGHFSPLTPAPPLYLPTPSLTPPLPLATWQKLFCPYLSIPIASRVFLAPSCTNFRVSGLMVRSLIHFELILVQSDRHGYSFSFLQMDNHFSQQHLLKRLSFLQCIFLAPVSKISWL